MSTDNEIGQQREFDDLIEAIERLEELEEEPELKDNPFEYDNLLYNLGNSMIQIAVQGNPNEKTLSEVEDTLELGDLLYQGDYDTLKQELQENYRIK